MSLAFATSTGLLMAVGVYFVLGRTTFRVVIGLLLMSYAVNLLVALSGGIGAAPPIVESEGSAEVLADPLPQALVLTAIVISLGMTTFLLAVLVARVSDRTGIEVEPLAQAAPDAPVGPPVPRREREGSP